jgi:tetratricopeptide (TPR) repeat protein
MASLYTAAMLAELVGVDAARVRAWQRRGWLVPVEQRHRLAQFDFAAVPVARQLAHLHRAGVKPATIARKLREILARAPHIQHPLAELSIVLDGRQILVREGNDLLEPGGQLRIDFDRYEDEPADEIPPTIPSATIFMARSKPAQEVAPKRLVEWAAQLEEAGDLKAAAEMYRAALAAGAREPEVCFQLAEVLYRTGDLPAARERYYQALEIDENYIEARANLGCVLLESGERELAAAAFAGALDLHEEYADVHFHLARTLDGLGRGEEACVHWQRFLELAPDSPWADEAHDRLTAGDTPT